MTDLDWLDLIRHLQELGLTVTSLNRKTGELTVKVPEGRGM